MTRRYSSHRALVFIALRHYARLAVAGAALAGVGVLIGVGWVGRAATSNLAPL